MTTLSPRLVAVVAVLLWLPACRLGPDPESRPRTAADGLPAFAADTTAAGPVVDPGRWWEQLGDPTTTRLVESALGANTDMAEAAARVLAARASLEQARGARLPTLDASLDASRSKTSIVLPNVGRVGVAATTYAAALAVRYDVDLFGRLSRTKQAAWGDYLASEASRMTVVQAVIAGTVRTRVRVATAERRLALAESTVSSWQRSADLVDRRYRRGLTSAVDLRLARQSLATATAARIDAQAELARSRHALSVLLGQPPESAPLALGPMPDLPELPPPPPGIPAALLDRRPDLMAARMSLYAANARVGAAIADLFPTLSLTGSYGTRSDALSELVSSDTVVYNLVGSLLAPIFHGGQLRARVRGARARADELAWSYAGEVLEALREVEDALVTESALRDRVAAIGAAAAEAREASRLARDRYERGAAGILEHLEAERRLAVSEDQLLVTQGNLWQSRVDFHQALGGDWLPGTDPHPELPPAKVAP